MPRRRKKFLFPEQRKPATKTVRQPLTFFYEQCDGGEIRWWRNDNPGDVFDIINREELQKRIDGARMCGVHVVDHLPGFCDLREECPDHKGYY